jgi:hypothetical protein
MHSSGVSFFSISRDQAQLVAQFKTRLQQGRRVAPVLLGVMPIRTYVDGWS